MAVHLTFSRPLFEERIRKIYEGDIAVSDVSLSFLYR